MGFNPRIVGADHDPEAAARLERLRLRAEAETKQCTYCHAIVGDPCVNPRTGEELTRQPAHAARIWAINEGGQ